MTPDRRRVLLGLAAALAAGARPVPAADRSPVPLPRPARAALSVAAEAPGPEGLDLLARAGLSGRSGWVVRDLDTGATLEAHGAEVPLAPASVAKLPTAVYAIDGLGAGHRFATRLLATGPLRNGRIEGDLVLAGSGDPEVDSAALAGLADGLTAIGVRAVAGAFVVSGGGFPVVAQIDPEQPVDVAYNPSVAGLNLNFNRVRVAWGGRGAGVRVSALAVGADPEIAHIRVTPGNGSVLFAHRDEGAGEHWTVAARLMRGEGARWLPVRRPLIYAGEVFRALAAARGLALPEVRVTAAPPPAGASVLAVAEGRALVDVVRGMLRHSTNLTAEALGLAAGVAGGSAPQGLAASAAAMNAWIVATVGGVGCDPAPVFANHSGLSVASRVSPACLVALLGAAARRPPQGVSAHPRLPGMLAPLLRESSAASEGDGLDHSATAIVAKTGTMDYVRGLAGYVATPGGRRLAFAILSNDLARRAGGVRQIDRRWMARARGFETALLRSWLRRFDA